jgi:hypothetical protein
MSSRRVQLAFGVLATAVLALAAASFAIADGGHHGRGNDENGFSARLIGYQEVPALNTPGHATFQATVASDKITFKLDYADLTGPPAVAHVHIGQRGVSGGVSFFLCGGGSKPPCPASPSGSVSGTVVASDVIGPTAQGFNPGDLSAVIAAMRAGVAYANMHTAKFPAGEIRGQLRGGEEGDHH